MSRYNKGWTNESARHGLAAKGVRTGKGMFTASAVRWVKLGYGDDYPAKTGGFRSVNFITDGMDNDDAQRVAASVDNYNEYDGKVVADVISDFKYDNLTWYFGREGSPVMYVDIPYWVKENGVDRKLTEKETDAVVSRLKHGFVGTAKADEFDRVGFAGAAPVDDKGHTVRIWWD